MKSPKLQSGSWLVIGLVSVGLLLALIALKFRRFPEDWNKNPAATTPSTTQPSR
jgi:hypothetical protein